MELESIATRAIAKHLIRSESGGCQPHAASGNFKDITVPMRSTKNFRKFSGQGIGTSVSAECHGKETNFLGLGPTYIRPESPRDQLSPQTKAEDWFLGRQSGSNQATFPIKIRIQGDLISTLPPATEHEAIEVCGINRQSVPSVGMNIEQLDTNFGKDFGEETWFVHLPMLDEENFFHVGNFTMTVSAVKQKKANFNCISALPRKQIMEKVDEVRPDCRIDI
jgi:hypothetical protein